MEQADEVTGKNGLHPIKVLVADDDAPTRILLRAAVSQWGYEVVEASDGEEAWTLLQQPDIPQLMIIDWLMPKLDGIDLCRRIKNELKELPYIILLTQLSGTTNIVKGLEAGANEFLSKPFNMAELQSRLSVGARIVRYKERLAASNVRLRSYSAQVDEIASNMLALTKEIEGVMAANGSEQQEKLKQLQDNFKQMVLVLEGLNKGLHEDGGES